MNSRHLRILGIIADLERQRDGQEVDEYAIAQACGAIPGALPRHAWVKHASRGELLQLFTALDQAGAIYVTRRGYWGFHLTQRGRDLLASAPALMATAMQDTMPRPVVEPVRVMPAAWVAPRPGSVPFTPRNDHFYSTMALAVAALGALLILAFGQGSFGPLAREGAAAPNTGGTPGIALPATATAPATAIVLPTASAPAYRTLVVANTGGEGVYLRRTPQYGDKIAAWPEHTVLEEIGPERTVNGVAWRYVRAPDSSEGYVPAQYTEVAE